MPPSNSLFAIIAVGKTDALRIEIQKKYPNQSIEASPGQWLIVRPSTTTTLEIANELGIFDGSVSSAIVLGVASYNGRTNPATWEWITAKTGVASSAT